MAKKTVDEIVEPISTEEVAKEIEAVEETKELEAVEAVEAVDNSTVGKIFDPKEEENPEEPRPMEPIISGPIKVEPIQLERPRKVYAKPNKRSKSVMTSVPMTFPGIRIGDFVKVEGKFRQIGQSYGWIYRPDVQ